MQGDVVGIYSADGVLKVSYEYDAWGNCTVVSDTSGIDLGNVNPIRYRGYYYDVETGFYYLQSRYYCPKIGRFLNSDVQLNLKEGFTGCNLFQYCGNNPVNRIDPTGEAWWHWALGAAVVAACAVATVVTCGGFAAAVGAVAAVGSGVAAATTASTIAAGAFIGSATVYGMAVLSAASTSNSVQEFNDQGNWGTVAATTFGGLVGGYDGYRMFNPRTPTTTSSNTFAPRGSTGRTEPMDLREQLAMEQVKSNPLSGATPLKIPLNDPRWPSSAGWTKMANNVNGVEIHFNYNETLGLFDDFKFVSG